MRRAAYLFTLLLFLPSCAHHTEPQKDESLSSQAVSAIDRKRGASERLGQILAKYPEAAYTITVGKPVIGNTEHRTNRATMDVPLVIRWDKAFLSEFKEILGQTATRDFNTVYVESFARQKITKDNQIVCFSTHAVVWSGKAHRCFALDKALMNEAPGKPGIAHKPKKAAASLLKLPPAPNSMSLFLTFKDAGNETIATATYKFSIKDDYRKRKSERTPGTYASFYQDSGNTKHASNEIDLLLEGGNEFAAFYPPGIIWRDPNTNNLMLIEDAGFKMTVPVPVSVEKLKDITIIEVAMEPWAN